MTIDKQPVDSSFWWTPEEDGEEERRGESHVTLSVPDTDVYGGRWCKAGDIIIAIPWKRLFWTDARRPDRRSYSIPEFQRCLASEAADALCLE